MSKKNAFELFLLSAVSLYIELLVIRWMSADIRAFTIFRTFPLIACFVGLGVGFALRKDDNYKHLPLSILLFGLSLKLADIVGISMWGFPALGVFQWNNLTGLLQINAPYMLLIMLTIILLLGIPFGMCVCIGARLGTLFSSLKPLHAYSLNVGGAIAGSILFPLLSRFGIPPWQLLLLPAVIVVIDLVIKTKKVSLIYLTPLIFIPLIYLMVPSQPGKPLVPNLKEYQAAETRTLWSPYQRIDLATFMSPAQKPGDKEQFLGLELSVNHLFYQYYFNTKPGTVLANNQLFDSIRKDYHLPFSFNQAKNVLIVGAGTGQNVSAAIEAGAEHVDAVEIDPVILTIGKEYNEDYSSPKVRSICDDARHFMAQTKNKYDVINFSTLDSHTVAGLGSSVRIDTYVYTKESIRQALSLLTEKGVVEISFATVAPWIKERLFETFRQAAGYSPIMLEGKMQGTIYVLGPAVKNHTLQLPTEYRQLSVEASNNVRTLTDDWPYLYVQPNIIDWPYLLVLIEIILVSIYAGRKFLFGKNNPSDWHMFLLGSAFLLLELHGISFLSLLFGSTWITSALVINSILVMILLANILVDRFTEQITKRLPLVYAALLISILTSYFLPTDVLLMAAQANQLLIYSLMTLITVLPMGIAALIFSASFAKVPNVTQALAFNLFGAVIGGLLEYLSNWWGIRSLDLVAAVLYLASLICYYANKKTK